MGDRLLAAAAAKEKQQAENQHHARDAQAWADKGAELDADLMRQIDRTRFGGILPPSFPARKEDGWIQPQTLWECPSDTQHAPLCTCDKWVHGHSINPAGKRIDDVR